MKLGPTSKISRYKEGLHRQAEAAAGIITLFDDIRARSIYPEGDFYKGMDYSKRTTEHRKVLQLVPKLQGRVKDANNHLSALNEAAVPVLKRFPELEELHQRIQPNPSIAIGLDLSGKFEVMRCRDAIEDMLKKLDGID